MNKNEIIKEYQTIICDMLHGSETLTDLDKIQLNFALAKDPTFPMDVYRRKEILNFIEELENFKIDEDKILWKN